ncbi:hypothetical protein [Subtercola boreus]|nr:hypothetical protein [Subtercola boreus]TQL52540.1 hypothetical protein FB464_0022 [Subtercola boreus]
MLSVSDVVEATAQPAMNRWFYNLFLATTTRAGRLSRRRTNYRSI